MNDADWLATWEPVASPGRHSKMQPAEFARGYRYQFMLHIDKRPRVPEVLPTMADRVSRAIPVEGTVRDVEPGWKKAPQVRFWLEEEKKPLGRRIREWLRRPTA